MRNRLQAREERKIPLEKMKTLAETYPCIKWKTDNLFKFGWINLNFDRQNENYSFYMHAPLLYPVNVYVSAY